VQVLSLPCLWTDARARELEMNPAVELASLRLADNDIVVRYRALRILAEKAPQVVAGQAVELLAVPNDLLRLLFR
jgi:hypothetical protein